MVTKLKGISVSQPQMSESFDHIQYKKGSDPSHIYQTIPKNSMPSDLDKCPRKNDIFLSLYEVMNQ